MGKQGKKRRRCAMQLRRLGCRPGRRTRQPRAHASRGRLPGSPENPKKEKLLHTNSESLKNIFGLVRTYGHFLCAGILSKGFACGSAPPGLPAKSAVRVRRGRGSCTKAGSLPSVTPSLWPRPSAILWPDRVRGAREEFLNLRLAKSEKKRPTPEKGAKRARGRKMSRGSVGAGACESARRPLQNNTSRSCSS